MSTVDYLNEDPKLEGQNFVCLSFLTPCGEDQTTLSGIKVRGVFDDYESACKRGKELQEMDPGFGVFVGEVGKWLPFDPDPDSKYVKDSEYANSELNEIMKNYRLNQEKSRIYHEKTKNDKLLKNLQENLGKMDKQLKKADSELKSANLENSQILTSRKKNLMDRRQETEEKLKNILEEQSKLEEEMKNVESMKGELRLPEVPRNVDLDEK